VKGGRNSPGTEWLRGRRKA